MRFLGIVSAFAVLLGVGLLAGRAGDRDVFVSPPAAVAEGFVREVIRGRYAEARVYLADPGAMSEEDLRTLRRTLVEHVGSQPGDYESQVVSRDEERARVTVTLTAMGRSQTVAFDLRFDSAWKVTSFPALTS